MIETVVALWRYLTSSPSESALQNAQSWLLGTQNLAENCEAAEARSGFEMLQAALQLILQY